MDWKENSSNPVYKVRFGGIGFEEEIADDEEEQTPAPSIWKPRFDLIHTPHKAPLSSSKVIMEQEEHSNTKEEQEILKLDKKRDFLKYYKNGVSTAMTENERNEVNKQKSQRSVQHGVSQRDIFGGDESDGESEWESFGVRRAWEIKAQIARGLFFLGNFCFFDYFFGYIF